MVDRQRAPIAILGAGLAGVTAAAALRERGIPFRLYEAGTRIAGLASSYKDAEGFTNDFGAHFITNRLAAAVGIAASCRDVSHYGEAVLLDGKTYQYPFGLAKSPRFMMSGIAARLRGGPKPRTVGEYFRRTYGNSLAERVAIPLVEAWSGAEADALAPTVASEKFRHGLLHSLRLSMASRITGRAVANGYSHELPENANVWHVYPEGGISTLVERLAENICDDIQLESPVQGVVVESGRAVAVQVGGRQVECSAVISTAPCNVLPKLVRGTDQLNHLAKFRFRPMIFVNLRLRGRDLLPDTVLWTPESDFPFFRVTETTKSMPWLAPAGKSLVTVDIGCEKTDALWTMPDDQLAELCLGPLERIVRDIRSRFLGVQVLRTPIAYPVFLNEYEESRVRFRESTGIEGLYSIGRNGEFAHILMEDVYWRTQGTVHRIAREWGAAA